MSAADPFDPAHFDQVINGTNGADVLSFPNSTLDLLIRGRGGADLIQGGTGDDGGKGGNGNDTFIAGRGDDLFDGENGIDTYDASQLISKFGPLGSPFTFAFGGRISKGNLGDDVIGVFDLATLSVTPVERIIAPLGTSDNLIDLSAQPGQSPDASAIVDLQAGTITLIAETVSGVPAGTVLFSVEARNFDDIIGTNFGDELFADRQANDLRGEAGDDTIDGRGGSDEIRGGGGEDDLRGGAGNDLLLGGSADDTLRGNNGQDRLDGGNGENTLTGNAGGDLFAFQNPDTGSNDEFDTITDFATGLDQILIAGAFSDFYGPGGLDFVNSGGDLLLVDTGNNVGDLGAFDAIVLFDNLAFNIANQVAVVNHTTFNDALIA